MAAEESPRAVVAAAVDSVLAELASFPPLTPQQREALCEFVDGKDVCAFLPTALSQSAIYQLVPLVMRKLARLQDPVVIVVSPMVDLATERVKEAAELGLSAAKLGDRDRDVLNGKCQLVFGTPQSWLLNQKWRKMLASKVYKENLAGIVLDEVHATYKCGKSGKAPPAFRESFAELGGLRSIVREGIPVLALTASAETTHRARVARLLHMEGAVQVTASLNRPNVRLGLCTVPDDDLSCLGWIVNMVKEKELSMNPVIVYCQSIVTVGRVFCYFKAELGECAWVNKDQRHENLLIGMFHSRTLQHNKDRVRKSLNGDGNCRVVVATTASGIGSTFPSVSHVVMYGSPKDVEALVQRVGTAGRHGLQSHAVLYIVRQATRDDTVKNVIAKSTSSCFRQALFSHFEDSPTSVEPGHLCCTFCQSRCVCGGEGCPVPPYELVEDAAASVPARRREVTPEDRQLVRECLEEYMVKLCGKTKSFFVPVELCVGFGKETIDAVVEHCEYIFDIEYILQNLPVFSRKHASEILLIISEVFEDFEYVHTTEPEEVVPVDINYTGYFDAPDVEYDP